DVQKHVFRNYSYRQGEYGPFSHELEAYFDNPILQTLEEFGIPTPLGKKLSQHFKSFNSIDDVLGELLTINSEMEGSKSLIDFEKIVLDRAVSRL
ncbi:hypothetical protein CGH81_24385, partial [Vibrio parahaemolyticus]|uniref:hypothetical protein n=1 Tax=Vibrio parahaemolyticus TaxID=670 RepID=UPI0011673783